MSIVKVKFSDDNLSKFKSNGKNLRKDIEIFAIITTKKLLK